MKPIVHYIADNSLQCASDITVSLFWRIGLVLRK